MNFDKNIYKISLFFFFVATVFGLLLRADFAFSNFSLPYSKIVQTHSHVAFLGWAYLAVTGFIMSKFLEENERHKKSYTILLSIISISIFLMCFSFPLYGYKSFSIALLSVFGITSVILSIKIYRKLKGENWAESLIKWSLIFYIISNLATWFFPVAIVKFGKGAIYFNTIYFYLHFLYNGFFVFALFGLLFKYFEHQTKMLNAKQFQIFLYSLIFGTVLSYILSVLWSTKHIIFNVLGGFSGLLLIVSLLYLLKFIRSISLENKWFKFLFYFAFISYILKVLAQFLSAFPWVVSKSLQLKRFFIIGYLHLFTLGFLSVFILFFLLVFKNLKLSKLTKLGLILMLSCIFLTEALLFGSGLLNLFFQSLLPHYNLLMFGFSSILVFGIGIVGFGFTTNK